LALPSTAHWRTPVLDVVFIIGILALVALIAAVGKGAERL
jgi:hypothetical protein